MIVVSDTATLEEHLTTLRDSADRVAFVPTMGNLHDGHLALVYQARAVAGAVVVSIFVNPMQFAAHEDLNTYPRTLDDDLGALREAGVDLVLTPSADDIYPDGSARHTAIHVPGLGDALCGKDRPGHFDGVCTVVYKLFQLVGPDIAVFGEKDLQQLLIIKKMVGDLGLPIDIQSATSTCPPPTGPWRPCCGKPCKAAARRWRQHQPFHRHQLSSPQEQRWYKPGLRSITSSSGSLRRCNSSIEWIRIAHCSLRHG